MCAHCLIPLIDEIAKNGGSLGYIPVKVWVRGRFTEKVMSCDDIVAHIIEANSPVEFGPNSETAFPAITQLNGTALCIAHLANAHRQEPEQSLSVWPLF